MNGCKEREKEEGGVATDLVHVYTRAQALADGTLLDVTETAHDFGFRCPVAISKAAHKQCVRIPDGMTDQDELGRLWDVLWMLRCSIRRLQGTGGETPITVVSCSPCCSVLLFELFVKNDEGGPKLMTLKATVGPGDEGERVITVCLPEED
jgi:hypothetical protein